MVAMDYNWLVINARRTCRRDIDIFEKATAGLSSRGKTPYGSDAHNVQVFRVAQQITGAKSVFEIGFNRGHGSAIWLSMGCTVHSIDVVEHPKLQAGVYILYSRFGRNFTYSKRSSMGSCINEFEIAFVDGDHGFEGVMADIELCRKLKIPWMLFDDFNPKTGPGVQKAIMESGIKMVTLIGNMALCRDASDFMDVPQEP